MRFGGNRLARSVMVGIGAFGGTVIGWAGTHDRGVMLIGSVIGALFAFYVIDNGEE